MDRTRFTTTVNSKLLTEFKEKCKEQHLNMSEVIDVLLFQYLTKGKGIKKTYEIYKIKS